MTWANLSVLVHTSAIGFKFVKDKRLSAALDHEKNIT